MLFNNCHIIFFMDKFWIHMILDLIGLRSNKTIINWKYFKSKVHLIHLTYWTSELSLAYLKCAQNTIFKKCWQYRSGCLPSWAGGWPGATASCHCPTSCEGMHSILLIWGKIKTQKSKYSSYWIYITFTPS